MAIGVDKNGDSDRNIKYEVKKQKAIEQELDHKFICSGIKNLILTVVNKIFREIKLSTKKNQINKILTKSLEVELEGLYLPNFLKKIIFMLLFFIVKINNPWQRT